MNLYSSKQYLRNTMLNTIISNFFKLKLSDITFFLLLTIDFFVITDFSICKTVCELLECYYLLIAAKPILFNNEASILRLHVE